MYEINQQRLHETAVRLMKPLMNKRASQVLDMRRFTRPTNAFSKKAANHAYATSLRFMYYNFCHTRKRMRMTPAMATGLVSNPWEVSDNVSLVEKAESEAVPKVRGPYKLRKIGILN